MSLRKIYTRIYILFSISMLLIGCAATPEQVIKEGSPIGFTSNRSSKSAAECLSLSSQNFSSNIIANYIPTDKEDTYQVIASSTVGDGGTWAVFLVSPNKIKGSIIDAYATNRIIFTSGKNNFLKSIAEKCL